MSGYWVEITIRAHVDGEALFKCFCGRRMKPLGDELYCRRHGMQAFIKSVKKLP